MLDGGDGVLGVIVRIPRLPNKTSHIDTIELDFDLFYPNHLLPSIL